MARPNLSALPVEVRAGSVAALPDPAHVADVIDHALSTADRDRQYAISEAIRHADDPCIEVWFNDTGTTVYVADVVLADIPKESTDDCAA